MNKYNVVYITDEKYAMPTCISMISLFKNKKAQTEIKVYVICVGLNSDSINKFKQLSTPDFCVIVKEVSDEMCIEILNITKHNRQEKSHVSNTALLKFHIPTLLKDEDKTLYLDGDTIIQKDFEKIFETDIDGNYLGAVEDLLGTYNDGYSTLMLRLGLKERRYFNSGVMLLNLKKIRQDSIEEKLVDYRLNGINYFMDQDTLNVVLGKKRTILPYKFNFMTTCMDKFSEKEICERFMEGKEGDLASYINSASILHLTDKYKPWEYNIPWLTDIYVKYYKDSPYRNQKIQFKSVTKAIKDEIWIDLKYIFPYERIDKGESIILYGAGNIGQAYYKQIEKTDYCKIVHWVDKAYANHINAVEPIDIIKNDSSSRILIAVVSAKAASEIAEMLVGKYQVTPERIVRISN